MVVSAVRRFRKTNGLKDAMTLAVRVHPSSDVQSATLTDLRPEIERLANVSPLDALVEAADPTGCARLMADGAQILIPLAGVLDPEIERARLTKRLAEIEREAAAAERKLSNQGFLAKAPAAVVQKEQARVASLKEEGVTLSEQLARLG